MKAMTRKQQSSLTSKEAQELHGKAVFLILKAMCSDIRSSRTVQWVPEQHGKQAVLGLNSLSDFTLRTSSISQRAGFIQPIIPVTDITSCQREKNCFLNIDFLSHCQDQPVSREPHLLLPSYTDRELCCLPRSISRAIAKLTNYPELRF